MIGSISFNVRDLLIGLSENDSQIRDKLIQLKKIKDIQKDLKKVSEIATLTNSVTYSKIHNDSELNVELIRKRKNLELKLNYLNMKLIQIKKQIKEVNGLKNYILNLNLSILVPKLNDVVTVTEENLVNFTNNEDYLKYQSTIIQIDINNVKNEIKEIENDLSEPTRSLFEGEDVLEASLKLLNSIQIDGTLLNKKKKEVENTIANISEDIEEMFMLNNEIITETTNWILKFAEILNVKEFVSQNNYLFTRDLKSIGGTIYYKVVFCFKMAYIKIIEKHTGIILPIILDSPSGREVTEVNITEVIGILNEYFDKNQIIIASIFDYDIKNLKKIVIEKNLLE